MATNRRKFIKDSAIVASVFHIIPRHVLGKGYISPSDKLNIACVGCGGKGETDIPMVWNKGSENIVALCDVDEKLAAPMRKKFPRATFYKDFREMLSNQKDIDAVTVTTPDHTHYVIAKSAMQLGKHVYVQKPLTHNISEARSLTEAAHRYKVVTQMGNQGASGDGVRLFQEWYEAGLIGQAHKVEVWTNRPIWPQGLQKPEGHHITPKNLDWDLWLGPAKFEMYNPAYHPFNWRGWVNYGTGGLGDMGCHIIDPPYRALKLGYPTEVECSLSSNWTGAFQEGFFPESFPSSSMIHLKFNDPKGNDIKLSWYDGGLMPARPDAIPADVPLGDWNGGAMIIGDKGVLMCGMYGMNPQLFPSSLMNETASVPKKYPRVINQDNEGHYQQWLTACKAGYDSGKWKELSSNFDYAGSLTETVLMGNLAIRSYFDRVPAKNKGWLQDHDFPGRKTLLWNGKEMRITNYDDANQYVSRTYREGWNF